MKKSRIFLGFCDFIIVLPTSNLRALLMTQFYQILDFNLIFLEKNKTFLFSSRKKPPELIITSATDINRFGNKYN